MNIVIDAFGGDNAPLEVIKGSIDAQKDFGVDVTLVGDEEKIKKCAQENGLDITALHIKHADCLEKATIETIEDGVMTGDLYLLSTLENKKKVNTVDFLKAVDERLKKLLG